MVPNRKQKENDGTASGIPRTNGAKPTPLEFALRAAERGWPVLPLYSVEDGECTCGIQDCSKAGKHPFTSHGVKDATTDKNQIRAWWRENPNANIGIATGTTSKLVVLDIDPRNGGDESLRQLEEECGALPNCPTVLTGGGGKHFYFRLPSGVAVKSKRGLRPGIDVCAEGSYVVAVGSTHKSGGGYSWVE
jgi:putative DNA primase/helicase